MKVPRSWRPLWYLGFLAALTLVVLLYTLTWARDTAFKEYGFTLGKSWSKPSAGEASSVTGAIAQDRLPPGMHPIKHLMEAAKKRFEKMERNEIHTIEQAAAQYRKLRGRNPPPGFDAWYKYATSHNAVINENFWNQIYHDLAPFWSLDPTTLRKQAHLSSPKIEIRSGKVAAKSYNEHGKMAMWQDMFTTLANDPKVKLPDVDIPLNVNDEPAMLVPWQTIDTAMSMGRQMIPEEKDVINKFSGLEDIELLIADFDWRPEWFGPRLTHPASRLGPRPLWSLVRPACPPSSQAKVKKVFNDIWDPEGDTKKEHSAAALLPHDLPDGTLRGYVQNWTQAIDACNAPNLQGLHSAFVAPKEIGVATKLFPLFGDTKFSMGNEIILPSATDWNVSSSAFRIAAPAWKEREDKVFWRTPATTSRNSKRYWQRFQSERLISMMNASHVEIAEASIHTGNESTVGVGYAGNFRLLPANEYRLKTQTGGSLAEWVNSWADAALNHMVCEGGGDEGCQYFQEYFSRGTPSTASKIYSAKYAISIDSSSSSLATSLHAGYTTLHASIYRNWYDSRLVPWLHFVPMDNTMVDLYGIMEYFLGSQVPEGAKDFKHAVGEVQKHEHHFNTPEGMTSHEGSHSSSQSGKEPHVPHHSPTRRSGSNDDEAQRIAFASKSWADKVLRREDMLIYVYRALLEYARVVDAKRDRLGWVEDLR